jgi:hypothetical protein
VAPVEPVAGGAVGTGWLVDGAGTGWLVDGAGTGGLGAAAAVVCCGRPPVPLAWCGAPEAQPDARIIKPAATAAAPVNRE